MVVQEEEWWASSTRELEEEKSKNRLCAGLRCSFEFERESQHSLTFDLQVESSEVAEEQIMASQGEKEKRPKAPTNSTSFFSATQFFEHQTPPPNLAAHHEQVQEFVDRHAKQGRKVVLVTVSLLRSHFHRTSRQTVYLVEWTERWNHGPSRAECVSPSNLPQARPSQAGFLYIC